MVTVRGIVPKMQWVESGALKMHCSEIKFPKIDGSENSVLKALV